jgi:hypothetical protein
MEREGSGKQREDCIPSTEETQSGVLRTQSRVAQRRAKQREVAMTLHQKQQRRLRPKIGPHRAQGGRG